MKPRLVFIMAVCLLLCLTFSALVSCSQEAGTGTMRILLHSNDGKTPKTIAPDESVNRITRYTVRGSGPGGKSFTMDSTSSSVILEGMPLGNWSLSATAYSSKGRELARGSTNASLTSDQEPVTVILDPVAGKGSMQIRFEWDSGLTGVSLKASLLAAAGASGGSDSGTGSGTGSNTLVRQQTFSPQSGVSYCSWTVSELDEGSYILSAELMCNSVRTGGAAEAVVIVSGEKTSGTVSLASDGTGNSGTSAKLSGLADLMASGESHTVTVVPEGYYAASSAYTVTWYLDGVQISLPAALKAEGNSITIVPETGSHTLSAVITDPATGGVTSASGRFTAKPMGEKGCAVYSSVIEHADSGPLYLNANQIVRPFAGSYFLSASPGFGTLQLISFKSGVLTVEQTLDCQDSLWSRLSYMSGLWADYRSEFAGFTGSSPDVNVLRLKNGQLEYALYGDKPEIVSGTLTSPYVNLNDIRCGSINPYGEDTCIFFCPSAGTKVLIEVTDTLGIKTRCGMLKPENIFNPAFIKANNISVICAGQNTGTLYAASFDGLGRTSVWKANTTSFQTIRHAVFLSDNILILSDGKKLALYSSQDGMTWIERRTSATPALDIQAVQDKGLFYVLTAPDTLASFKSNGTVIEHLGSATVPFGAVSIAAGPDHILAVSADGDIAIYEIAGGDL